MVKKFLFIFFLISVFFLPTPASADIINVPTQDEFQQLVNKPTHRVQIPGLTYTNIKTVDEDGTTYIYIPYIGEYLSVMYRYVIIVAAVICVIMIIVSGMQWTASGGNSSTIDSAKKRISNAIIGLILSVGSYTILYTINPELVAFRSLKVKYIEKQTLENTFESPNSDISNIGTGGNCNSYDTLFQKYAPCLGSDWKALKAISAVESGCNPKADNHRGYVGIGQTNIANCKSIFKNRGYENLVDYCTIPNLQTAPVGIAIISLLQKEAADLIKSKCQGASPTQQGTAFHAYNNIPLAARAYINGGCKNDSDFVNAFVRFYSAQGREKGFLADSTYMSKFKSAYDSGGVEAYLRAIGQYKFEYAKTHAGPLFANLGGNVFLTNPSGECPLKGDNPFSAIRPEDIPRVQAPSGARDLQ